MLKKILVTTGIFIVFFVTELNATGKTLEAIPLEESKIIVDGLLNEQIWMNVPFKDDFIQREPVENIDPTERTEFSILYDKAHIYIGIKAFTKDPNTIKGVLTRRDEWSPSDWLVVFIDSYNDNRTAFSFAINPAGVKQDIRWSNDEEPDMNWNAVWGGQASVSSDGWSAEF